MRRLLLVRHGESTWNAEGRWQGQADPPLSARGEAQARAAGPAAAALGPFDVLAASPLQRARRTAELLAIAMRGVPASVSHAAGPASRNPGAPQAVPGLEEREAGPWTGLTHAEIDARDPGARQGTWRPEGYESDAALRARATKALLGLSGERVLVVVHEGLLRSLDGDAAALPNLGARWFEIDGEAIRPHGPRLALAPPGA